MLPVRLALFSINTKTNTWGQSDLNQESAHLVKHNRGNMQSLENVVWSVMLGGLLTIGIMAIMDVARSRTLSAWRSLVFLFITASSCLLLSGLPEDLFPWLPTTPVLILKASLGPLSGAMVLIYLGQWLGSAADDRLVFHIISSGSKALVICAFLISGASALIGETYNTEILLFAAVL